MRRLAVLLLVLAAGLAAAATAAQAAPVVRTVMHCSGDSRWTYSASVPPHSGYFQRRVAYYNRSGVRMYLSGWYWAGYMTPLGAGFGGYGWSSPRVNLRGAWRALVLYRDYNDMYRIWSGWSAGGCGR
jgi:opacity protein-like surface antigen